MPAGALVTAYEDPTQSPNGSPFVVETYRPAPTRATEGGGAAPPVLAMADRIAGGGEAALTVVTTTATCSLNARAKAMT